MAKIGLRHIVWSRIESEPEKAAPVYGTGKVIGAAIGLNVEVSLAEAPLYADDKLKEQVSEFSGGKITSEFDDISIANRAELVGAAYENGELVFGGDDPPPYGGLGGVVPRIKNNVRSYIGVLYHKVKAKVPGDSFTTKGNSVSFGTQPLEMDAFLDNARNWRTESDPFASESAAIAWVDTKLNAAAWHTIEVQVQGVTAGKNASPAGASAVADAGNFVLTITGTPVALYDNGVESKDSIAAGKYTLSNVTAPHKIAVIF